MSNGSGEGGRGSSSDAERTAAIANSTSEASEALGTAKFAGALAREIGGALGSTQPRHVEYELDIDGSDERWSVRSFVLHEELSGTYEAVLRVRCENRDVDVVDTIVGKDASLLIDRRDDHNRRACGIIHRVVELGARQHHTELELHVVPAFALLRHGSDSRVFQDKTAVEIVEEVLGAAFAPYRREVDASGLAGSYATREMCVQYRESYKDFVSRLLEEEGIGYYFDFDGEGHERMVLFDANQQLAPLATMDGNAVPFAQGAHVIDGREPVVSFEATHRLGATSITVRDLDWTESQYRAEASRDGQDERGYTRAVYDHGHARNVTLYEFSPGGRYGANDADLQARIRSELLARDQHRFAGASMLVGLRPGVTFELSGHPVPGMDGRYLVVKVRHASEAPPGVEGQHGGRGEEYHNTFECISAECSYVPDRRTPKPAIAGVQTAVVSGPTPGEPYTDEYGRVKVQFHWDREAIDPARTSAWVRLGQTWAGHDGSGLHTFLFIPRVNSEVIVTFLDGDPDRPLVTGAVYNAQNRPPLSLPDEATRSVIRTETIGGGGHNELSFEDAAGREEVYLRAERDLRELVQHNHATHVQAHQTNTVDGNQTETIGGNQTMTVRGDREHHVEGSEQNFVDHMRTTRIGENESLHIGGFRSTNVDHSDNLYVTGDSFTHVRGTDTHRTVAGVVHWIEGGGVQQTIQAGGWTLTTTGNVNHTVTGGAILDTTDGITMNAGASVSVHGARGVEVSGQSITLRSNTTINYSAPGGLHNVTPGTETHTATEHNENAQSWYEKFTVKTSLSDLAFATTMLKIDIVTGVKIVHTSVEVASKLAKLDLVKTVDLKKALVHLIG